MNNKERRERSRKLKDRRQKKRGRTRWRKKTSAC
jgi:hypothetical protein